MTGAAQSPAIEARFPWYVRLWGGRQSARNLHLFGLLIWIGFIAIHLIMVASWGWGQLNALMIFGEVRDPGWAIALSLVIIAAIVAVHWVATVLSLKRPRTVQRALGAVVMGARTLLLRPLVSRQDYSTAELSPEHRVNGKPPDSDYKVMAVHNFVDWRLEVGGLVERPRTFSLEDLRALGGKQTQRVLHNCIQGWTSIGEWSGLPMRDMVELVKPLPQARYVCFLTMQDTGRDDPSAEGQGQFYEVLDLAVARQPHTLLAYEMNGEPLPIKHGAPLRLRVENQVGFKMAKWIERIEFVSDYSDIGAGMGGWREDNVFYDKNVKSDERRVGGPPGDHGVERGAEAQGGEAAAAPPDHMYQLRFRGSRHRGRPVPGISLPARGAGQLPDRPHLQQPRLPGSPNRRQDARVPVPRQRTGACRGTGVAPGGNTPVARFFIRAGGRTLREAGRYRGTESPSDTAGRPRPRRSTSGSTSRSSDRSSA